MVKIKSKPKRWGFGTNRPLIGVNSRRYKPQKPWVAYMRRHFPGVRMIKSFKPSRNAGKISRSMSLTQRKRGLYRIMASYNKRYKRK